MRNYELVTVISPEIDDEEMPTVMDKVNRFISDKEGVVAETERWGMRKLAYPIKHFMEGSYILTRFQLEPQFIRELEAELGASEEILRHLVLKVDN